MSEFTTRRGRQGDEDASSLHGTCPVTRERNTVVKICPAWLNFRIVSCVLRSLEGCKSPASLGRGKVSGQYGPGYDGPKKAHHQALEGVGVDCGPLESPALDCACVNRARGVHAASYTVKHVVYTLYYGASPPATPVSMLTDTRFPQPPSPRGRHLDYLIRSIRLNYALHLARCSTTRRTSTPPRWILLTASGRKPTTWGAGSKDTLQMRTVLCFARRSRHSQDGRQPWHIIIQSGSIILMPCLRHVSSTGSIHAAPASHPDPMGS